MGGGLGLRRKNAALSVLKRKDKLNTFLEDKRENRKTTERDQLFLLEVLDKTNKKVVGQHF